MEDNSMDESWVGDKVLARLGGVQPQAPNDLAQPVARNDLSPLYPASPYPRTMSGHELQHFHGSPVHFQGKPASNLHQAHQSLSFPAAKGQVTGPGVAMTQGPGTAPLSSEPVLTAGHHASDTLLRTTILPVSTTPASGAPLRSMAFPRSASQSHQASPMRSESTATSSSALYNLAAVSNSFEFSNSSNPGKSVAPSGGALAARPSDCFYFDPTESPRLRPSLRLSGRAVLQQINVPGSPKMPLGSVSVATKVQPKPPHELEMSNSLSKPTKDVQRLPIRSVATEATSKTAAAASTLVSHSINAPSQPRAMRETKVTETKITTASEGSGANTNLPKLREVDLAKWPCRTCLFVHRGNECETICIGCRSKDPDRHDPNCPYKNRNRFGDFTHSLVKQEMGLLNKVSFNDTRSEMFPSSVTTKLSFECQKRGFNPEFRYFTNEKTGDCMADLRLKGNMISGDGCVYRSQKEAREALAEKGLKIVLTMEGHEKARRLAVPPRTMICNEDSAFEVPAQRESRDSSIKHNVVTMIKARPPSAVTKSRSEYSDLMDIDKSAETAGKYRADSSPNIKANLKEAASLPTNINAYDVPRVIEKIIANGPAAITFNLPANVSTEIAEAYGRGFAMVMHPRRRTRSRSRSRSPARDRPRIDSDYREREEYFNRLGRLPMRDEYRPSRDDYRGARDRGVVRDRAWRRADDARLRLSPPNDLMSRKLIKEEPRSPDAHQLDKRRRY